MSALTVAGKEFDDAIRSRALWVASAVFVGAMAAVTVGYAVVAGRPTTGTLLVYVIELTKWLVPVVALVAGYDAVVGERARGTLHLLFGLPYARWEVLAGKAIGRYAAVVAPVVAGLVVSFVLSVVLYARIVPGKYAVLLLATAALSAAFVSLAVAASALARTPVRVVATVVGAFVLFLFLWDLVPAGVHLLVSGSVPGAHAPPEWFFLLERVNPVESFLAVLASAYPDLADSGPAGAVTLTGWFAFGLLCTWALLPLAVAFARFRTADLS